MIGEIRIATESLSQGNKLMGKGSIFTVDKISPSGIDISDYVETNSGFNFPIHMLNRLSRPMNIWDKLKLIFNI